MIGRNMFKFLSSFVLLILLTGCVNLNFPQFNSVFNQWVGEPVSTLDKFTWYLRSGDYKTVTYLVNTGQQTVFASENNDVLTFANNEIKSIAMLNGIKMDLTLKVLEYQEDEISSISNYKTIKLHQITVNDKLLVNYECSVWQEVSPQNQNQVCKLENQTFVNKRSFDNENKLNYLEQWFPTMDSPLVLTRKL